MDIERSPAIGVFKIFSFNASAECRTLGVTGKKSKRLSGKGILADKKKNEFSVENGIKLIRIPDDDKVWDAVRLKKLIDSVPYPTATYCSNLLDGRPPSEERRLQKDREKRQEQYRRNKERRKLMDEKKEN